MKYFMDKKYNNRALQLHLIANGFGWAGFSTEPHSFTSHLFFDMEEREITKGDEEPHIEDGKLFFKYGGEELQEHSAKPITLEDFQDQFLVTLDTEDYQIELDHILRNTQYVERNAMYPYETRFNGKIYHFDNTNQIRKYFQDKLGYEVIQ